MNARTGTNGKGACQCSLCQVPRLYELPLPVRVELIKLAFTEMPKATTSQIIMAVKQKFANK
ncbi:hypothetical protein HZB94_00170 [Candidatus Falkowbacteria bacterium]|nr:hypothetical protein [Candidatus Falkowbacteria bacterium]